MAADLRFGPASPFGVPVTPFMPGVRWRSLKQLFSDVLSDLKNDRCRNFLLGVDPLEDIRILTAHHHNSNTPKLEFIVQLARNEAISIEPFHAPATDFASRSVGIFVTRRKDFSGATSATFCRSAFNHSEASLICIERNDRENRLKVVWWKSIDQLRYFAVELMFDTSTLGSALEVFSSIEKYATLEQGLISSAVYLLNPHNLGKSIPGFIGPASFTLVTCSFCLGKPYSSQVAFGSTTFGSHLSTDKVESVRGWAIGNRLSLLEPTPPQLLEIDFNFSNIPDLLEDESYEQQLTSRSAESI